MLRAHISQLRLALREARTIRVSLLVALGMNLLSWSMYLWFVLPRLATSPFFALHYTVYFGVDLIGAPWRLITMPLIGLVILLMNTVLVARIYINDRLTATLIMIATLFFEAMLLWTVFLNILLNV